MLNRRGLIVLAIIWAAFAILCLLGASGKAADAPSAPIGQYTCEDIRRVVAQFRSAWLAEKAARRAGATDEQIAQAKRCLKR